MFSNCAYIDNPLADFEDKTRPLVVVSCGTYRMISLDQFHTLRSGRKDYQILYIASGSGHFFIDGEEYTVPAGNMVFYQPGESNDYIYYGTDKTEVFWVHFTGSAVNEILARYKFPIDSHIFYTGVSSDFSSIFLQIIREIQGRKPDFEEFISLKLQELLVLIYRHRASSNTSIKNMDEEIQKAYLYFCENYNKPISIEDYAHERYMSSSWFTQNFKEIIGTTPLHFILSVRMLNAQQMLIGTKTSISEISRLVGYDNPLYFSRIFKKWTGESPSDYRKQNVNKQGLPPAHE